MVTVNYCPVCKREYTQKSRHQTGLCPVCGSTLVQISNDAMEKVRRKNIRKKE
jgi:Zn finger protein HypA/HybF involved in hydrogenase expression